MKYRRRNWIGNWLNVRDNRRTGRDRDQDSGKDMDKVNDGAGVAVVCGAVRGLEQ